LIYLVLGAGLIASGVLIIRFHARLNRQTGKMQQKLVGRSTAAAFRRLQSPFWIGAAGLVAIGMGLLKLSFGVVVILRMFA